MVSRRAGVERGPPSGSWRARLPDGAARGERLCNQLSGPGLPRAGVQVEWVRGQARQWWVLSVSKSSGVFIARALNGRGKLV